MKFYNRQNKPTAYGERIKKSDYVFVDAGD